MDPQPYVASVHYGCGFMRIYTIIFYFYISYIFLYQMVCLCPVSGFEKIFFIRLRKKSAVCYF